MLPSKKFLVVSTAVTAALVVGLITGAVGTESVHTRRMVDAQSTMPQSIKELAAAERAFADDGARDGVQKSFLAHFAADSLVFKPYAIAALPWYQAHPDQGAGKLIWSPQYLATSSAGDLGLSSGPWRYEAEHDGKPVRAWGHFFSIWRRNAQGVWEVFFDHGISHEAVEVENVPLIAMNPAKAAHLSTQELSHRQSKLIAADEDLRKQLLGQRADLAYASTRLPDTLWLRDDSVPARGAPTAAVVNLKSGIGSGARVAVGVAASGDLGYTLGGSEVTPEKGVYARVWRYQTSGGWKLLADLSAASP